VTVNPSRNIVFDYNHLSLPYPELQNQCELKWLQWYANHTTDWLDTRIHSTGIHSYLSTRTFSSLELSFLSNGLRFICTPPKTNIKLYEKQFLQEYHRGFVKYSRNLMNRLLFHDSEDNYIPKFKQLSINNNSSKHYQEEKILEAQSTTLAIDLHWLKRYTDQTLALLTNVIKHSNTAPSMYTIRSNHTEHDRQFLKSILVDSRITIKPADKNLGLALVDTQWYEQELTTMLSDTNTYTRCTTIKNANGKNVTINDRILKQKLIDEFNSIIKKNEELIKNLFPDNGPQIIKYLRSHMKMDHIKIPEIYLLIKVHKPKGLCGRPIVPCSRAATTPASVLCDHMLQNIMEKANIPWLVKDSKSLVRQIESTKELVHDGTLVGGDIGSLYTNIETSTGLQLVKAFLELNNVEQYESKFIIVLLTFVLRNSYISYKNKIYHQHNGTAMGTACAPSYANIVVYMLEKDFIIQAIKERKLLHYRRFLDDVEAYVIQSFLDEFKARLNQFHSSLTFEFEHDQNSIAFLDLVLHKGERFHSDNVFDIRLHQKKMNLYLYIPYNSFHPLAAKKSFIQTELMRYIRNNSNMQCYEQLRLLFFKRLRDRGYPIPFLTPLFDSIYYSDRKYFLMNRNEFANLSNNTFISNGYSGTNNSQGSQYPFKSECLIRKHHRLQQSNMTTNPRPNVFVIPYNPLSAVIPVRNILDKYWDYLSNGDVTKTFTKPLIAFQSCPSLTTAMVYNKVETVNTKKSFTQTKVQSFFKNKLLDKN
jgi:hypothetical protein